MNHPTIGAVSTIAEAKQRLSITGVWPILGLTGKPSKSCKSPFRADKRPSFSVYVGRDGIERWKDHATGEDGDAISFLAKARGIDNKQATREFLELAAGGNCGTRTAAHRWESRQSKSATRRVVDH